MIIKLPSKKNLLYFDEYKIRVFYDDQQNYYKVCAYNSKGEDVSSVTFKLNLRPTKHVWIYKISTNEKYQHKGYATALLYVMEYIAFSKKFDQIEAKFYPDNEHAKSFYEKNDYIIYKDGYDTLLTKTIEYDFVKKNIEPYIDDLKVEKLIELER